MSHVYLNFYTYKMFRAHHLSYPRPGDQYLPGVWLFIWDKVENTRQFALPDDNLVQDLQNS